MSILNITQNRFERLAAEQANPSHTPKQSRFSADVGAGRSSHRNDFASGNNRGMARKSRSESCPPPQATDFITWMPSTPTQSTRGFDGGGGFDSGGFDSGGSHKVPEVLGARARGSFEFGYEPWANKPKELHFAGRPGFLARSSSPRSVRRVGYSAGCTKQNWSISGQLDSNARENASSQHHSVTGFEESYTPRLMKHRATMRRSGRGLNGHEDVYEGGQREFTSGDCPASDATQRLNDKRHHMHEIAPRRNLQMEASEDLAHCFHRDSTTNLLTATVVLAEEAGVTPRSSIASSVSRDGPRSPTMGSRPSIGVGRVSGIGGVLRSSAPDIAAASSPINSAAKRSFARGATSPTLPTSPNSAAGVTSIAQRRAPSPSESSASSVATSSVASLGLRTGSGPRFQLTSPASNTRGAEPPATPKQLRLFRDPRES